MHTRSRPRSVARSPRCARSCSGASPACASCSTTSSAAIAAPGARPWRRCYPTGPRWLVFPTGVSLGALAMAKWIVMSAFLLAALSLGAWQLNWSGDATLPLQAQPLASAPVDAPVPAPHRARPHGPRLGIARRRAPWCPWCRTPWLRRRARRPAPGRNRRRVEQPGSATTGWQPHRSRSVLDEPGRTQQPPGAGHRRRPPGAGHRRRPPGAGHRRRPPGAGEQLRAGDDQVLATTEYQPGVQSIHHRVPIRAGVGRYEVDDRAATLVLFANGKELQHLLLTLRVGDLTEIAW